MQVANLSEWRSAVLARYSNRCAVCGDEEQIEAHHILPKAHYDEMTHDTDNGIALCVMCHKAVHRHGNPRLRGVGRSKSKTYSHKAPKEIGKWEFEAVFKYITQNMCPRKIEISEFFLGYELFNGGCRLSKDRFLAIIRAISDRSYGEVISFISDDEIKINPLAMEFPDCPEAEAEIITKISSIKRGGVATLFSTIPQKIANKIQLFEKRKEMRKLDVLDKLDVTRGWRIYASEYHEELCKIYNEEVETDFREDFDQWIDECADLTEKNSWTSTRELYESWMKHKSPSEERYNAVQKFGAKLGKICYPLRKGVVRGFLGIRLAQI